ncbi:MAG: hypothetical protein WCC10_15055 [Tumebacillaceae bacterium]
MTFPYPINTLILTNRTNRSFEKREETRFLVMHETVSQADARKQYAYFYTHDNAGVEQKRDPYVFIRSHHEIAIEFGGTDHTDPDEYFAAFGKSVNQFRADLLGALYKATNDSEVRDAAHYAADALRTAAGIPK